MPEEEVQKYHPVPAWLNTDYIQIVLRKHTNDEHLSVLSLVAKPATAAGENYASVMTRITVVYRHSKSSEKHITATYIVKTTYADEDPAADLFRPYGIYTREMDMYETILPQLAKILHETGCKEKLFAETIYVDRKNSSIIFEDLGPENYVTANRIQRFDMEHAKLALSKLATMHATAAVLNERKPKIFSKNFDRGFFNRHTAAYTPIMLGLMKAAIRYVKTQTELSDKYYDKLVALTDNFMEYGARAFDVNNEHFMTLIHGDYWTTNIMFKYSEDNKPRNVIPIDFQFCTWTSPAVDLHYFFNSSLREELRLASQPELLQYYYYNLRDTLKALNFQGHIPSLFQFNLQFQMRSFIAVFTSFTFQTVMIYDGNEKATVEAFASENEADIRLKDSCFQNVEVQKYLHKLLPIFDQKGLLDRMD